MRALRPVLVGTVAACALALTACGGGSSDVREQRGPDATGTVVSVASGSTTIDVEFKPDAGDEYYDGTVFRFAVGGALEKADGEPAVAADVSVGDRLEVWTEACAESFPVQCADPVGRLLP